MYIYMCEPCFLLPEMPLKYKFAYIHAVNRIGELFSLVIYCTMLVAHKYGRKKNARHVCKESETGLYIFLHSILMRVEYVYVDWTDELAESYKADD